MLKNLWYNQAVQKKFEKKSENLGLKVQASTLESLGEIATQEDRPLGYVARELMIRGIGLYLRDGLLRDQPATATERPKLAPVVGTISSEKAEKERVRREYIEQAGGRPLAPSSKKEMPLLTGKDIQRKKKIG